MADNPGIESLREGLVQIAEPAQGMDDLEPYFQAQSAALTELAALRESDASLRAENERLRLIETGAKDSEALVAHLRAENEALKKDLEECKSKRKAFIEEVKAKLLDRDTLLANWNEALEERDALAARVEALNEIIRDVSDREGLTDQEYRDWRKLPPIETSLSAHDARVRREALEWAARRCADAYWEMVAPRDHASMHPTYEFWRDALDLPPMTPSEHEAAILGPEAQPNEQETK